MATLSGALLCDAASECGGKVSILGGFVSTVGGPSFPIRANVWFVARLDWDDDDYDRPHVMILRCQHQEDGEQLAQFEATIDGMQRPPQADPDLPIGSNVILPLPLEFRRPGMYAVTLSVDGEELVRLPIKPRPEMPSL